MKCFWKNTVELGQKKWPRRSNGEGALGLSQFLGGEMTSSGHLFPQTLHISTSSNFEVYGNTAANPVSISEGTLPSQEQDWGVDRFVSWFFLLRSLGILFF